MLVDAACDLACATSASRTSACRPRDAGARRAHPAAGGVCYLEVVSTTPEAVLRSLEVAQALGVDRVLGGTDLDAADASSAELARYFPFPGRPVGHPTRLDGTAALVAEHCRPRARGCGGVDLLAYRATEADPLDLVRAARAALPDRR